MPLSPEQIKQLLSSANKPKRGGRRSKGFIDTSSRDILTWFKLGHKLMNEETQDAARCSNPNCQDTRNKMMTAEVNGILMCRRCFLDGYQAEVEGQEVLPINE